MSDYWISVIPRDPYFIPEEHSMRAALTEFAAIAPDADKIQARCDDGVHFFDCGSNLESVSCPGCGKKIPTDFWQNLMDADFQESSFQLEEYPLPCCGGKFSLANLDYQWPQGLARFGIGAMNAGVRELTPEQATIFAQTLGTPVKVIYRRF